MALFSDLPVYKATYDLLLAIFRVTKDFSKDYKYTVGESIKKETIELLTLIYRANIKRDKNEVLQEAKGKDRDNQAVYSSDERYAANQHQTICSNK